MYELLYELNYLGKYVWICNCKIGEDFSVESNTLYVHCMDKLRVSHTILTSGVIETNCPKLTKLTLLELATNICILSCLHDSSLCARVYISIHSTESFCKSEDTFMSFVCHHTTFYASHRKKVKSLYGLNYLP